MYTYTNEVWNAHKYYFIMKKNEHLQNTGSSHMSRAKWKKKRLHAELSHLYDSKGKAKKDKKIRGCQGSECGEGSDYKEAWGNSSE